MEQPISERSSGRDAALALQQGVKCLVDIVIAGSTLLVLSPLFPLIALAIKLNSPGPVLYRWKVVGQDGRYFTGYKFRTMVVNADALKAQLAALNEMKGPMFKITNDPRVTSVGRFLRKYSLDELPQLWSVVCGDMSLIGPRPPLQTEYALFTEFQKQKLTVKPGITGLWQVAGRNEITDFDEWVRLDLSYIENWSLWLDFKILALTVLAVVKGTGK